MGLLASLTSLRKAFRSPRLVFLVLFAFRYFRTAFTTLSRVSYTLTDPQEIPPGALARTLNLAVSVFSRDISSQSKSTNAIRTIIGSIVNLPSYDDHTTNRQQYANFIFLCYRYLSFWNLFIRQVEKIIFRN